MSLALTTHRGSDRPTVIDVLADGRRRRILAVLLGQSAPVSVEDLAADLAAETGSERRALGVELVHRHVPALVEADLVAWDREAGTVTTTDDPALENPAVRRIVGKEGEKWDEMIDCLADVQRRTVLAELGSEGSTSQRALARTVAERVTDGDPSPDRVEETLRDLHHVHLPKLAAAGLVEYDGEAGTVDSRDHGAFDALATSVGDD